MDLSLNVGDFATGTYTVTRRNPAVVTDGRAAPATAATFTIQASVFPANGRTLQRLPEGMRVIDHVQIFTTTPLRCSGSPDIVRIGADDYEVDHVTGWTGQGGDFYDCLALKLGN